MDRFTNDFNWYEIHYVLNGSKKRLVVVKASMSELDAWLCAALYVGPDPAAVTKVRGYAGAVELAAEHNIKSVRWNRLQGQKPDRPGLRIFGDTFESAIYQSFRSE